MENKSIFKCPHIPKVRRLIFSCNTTGDYALDLCELCYEIESKDFLISEEPINEK